MSNSASRVWACSKVEQQNVAMAAMVNRSGFMMFISPMYASEAQTVGETLHFWVKRTGMRGLWSLHRVSQTNILTR
jgi:hypothetical protein